ncbi:MAG: hypothetical protein QG567_1322 [Campylobacterota bacterium]|nr:hypothetical protein [Campylobacterota bacterium]
MKKFLLIIPFLFVTTLFGYSYNDLLIKAQSSIFPKILLLDKKLDEKLVDGKIVYAIAYDDNDYHTAMQVRKLVENKYKNRLGEYELVIKVIRFSDLSDKTKVTAVYALNSSDGIDRVSSLAKESGFMTFAYDIENLKHGLLLSLMVEKSTVIYLSKPNLQNHKVDFVDSLYQLVRFAAN